ncbi:mitochondrial peptide-transporting ATPase [Schizosaccharomyces pombe]|uniref:ATP-dependent permease MDL1, mitochondrial n=1 Tax=Schizosaccharomyces pombe (strain 972 / ATCC 24843) TaxID=284812 RepID=MDL1_SCHPO|nr:peptide-transporting ATPase [Schizosaccharomyces pombe]Q9Y7M7.1 RecName: Full=ATP-dependent permease MDL1, mitochondrial; AltName: Full=ABC transporter mdl1; Flags: Precursor [Schizosaccharomyces pombe 972h-]CAB42370.1 mitochondrial peptide-transporting ATPase [Schizosaccharomyces pombe]|eukprot:NP_595751.1 peptide-transporting ATPase [Schizosaccharomyces pombe]
MDPIRFGLSRVPFAHCYNKRVIFRANYLVPLTWLKNNVAYKSTNTLLLPTPNAEYYSTSKLSSQVNVSLNSLSQKASSGSKIYPFKNSFPLPFSRSILPIRSLAFLKLCVRHNSTVPSKDEQAQDISKINTNGTLQTPNKKVNVFRLFTLARGQGWNFFIAGSLLLVSSGVTMSIPYIVGKILDAGSSGDSSVTHIMGIPSGTFYIGLLGLFFLGSACNFGRIITLRLLSERIVSRLRARLFAKCMSLDGAFFDFHKHGDLISRLTTDSSIVGKSLSMYLSDGLRSSVSAIAGIGMMLYVSMRLTGYMSLIVPPIALGAFFYGEYVRKLSRTTQDALGDLTRVSEEKLANVRTTQAFLGERQEVNRYNDYIRNLFVLAKREAFASGIFFGSTGFLGNATVIAILALGGRMVAAGDITVGQLSSFLLYTVYAGGSIVGLSGCFTDIMKGLGAASRLFELLDAKPKIAPTVGIPVPVTVGKAILSFRNVGFAYPTRPSASIFDNLSFDIHPGTNVAIVAPSGGGKSTISQLLLRFYAPSSGKILADGVDISTYNVHQWRSHFGLVGQEPVLFSGTIGENIAYGKSNASQEEIEDAAKRANCSFVLSFPEKWSTQVGTRGLQLSGGQKQRIAIARALLRNPAFLILDEATSALDGEAEVMVDKTIQSLMHNRSMTTITIAHKLATIRRADQIIVVGDGKVLEQGSFERLSRPGTNFYKLMRWQLGKVEP